MNIKNKKTDEIPLMVFKKPWYSCFILFGIGTGIMVLSKFGFIKPSNSLLKTYSTIPMQGPAEMAGYSQADLLNKGFSRIIYDVNSENLKAMCLTPTEAVTQRQNEFPSPLQAFYNYATMYRQAQMASMANAILDFNNNNGFTQYSKLNTHTNSTNSISMSENLNSTQDNSTLESPNRSQQENPTNALVRKVQQRLKNRDTRKLQATMFAIGPNLEIVQRGSPEDGIYYPGIKIKPSMFALQGLHNEIIPFLEMDSCLAVDFNSKDIHYGLGKVIALPIKDTPLSYIASATGGVSIGSSNGTWRGLNLPALHLQGKIFCGIGVFV